MKQRQKFYSGLSVVVVTVALVSTIGKSEWGSFTTSEFLHFATPAPSLLAPVNTTPADLAVRVAETEIARLPTYSDGYVALADAYMRKSRESGDSGYYLRAEGAVQKALALQPDSQLALRTLAWVQTGKHEFRAALATAEQLLVRTPHDPLTHALLGDAAVEVGDYERAATAFARMVNLRPGMASYSRLAYIRELFGDPSGALELMQLAVKAGSRQDPEPLAWALVQLGNLYFHQGQQLAAETAYQTALTVFPHYHQALAVLGRLRASQQQYTEAIRLYRQAIRAVPAPDTIAELGDVFALIGQSQEAERQYALVEYIEGMPTETKETYGRQLARFYADHDRKLDIAVQLAERERRHRNDIYTADTLAWAYYKVGRYAEAWQTMTQALRLGTQDARLFFHAGMIAYRLQETEKARHYLQAALSTNPYFSLTETRQAHFTLAELMGTASAR